MSLRDKIRELDEELAQFKWRIETLPGGLVMLGLAADVLETAEAVRHTAESRLPHKAFSNARLAFEAAQNLLVLATHEDYQQAGVRAWVYFEHKTASWRATAARQREGGQSVSEREILERRVEQMTEAWGELYADAALLLRRAFADVWEQRRRRPDNWLHENMSERQHRAYTLFAGETGGRVSTDTGATNRAMYEVLCHETHAHPRLDQFLIRVDKGRFTVVRRTRGAEAARTPVTGGTEMAVMETIAALRWLRTGGV